MEPSTYKKVNFHTHCYRCLHAKGTVSQYALEAVHQGLTALGFSDHIPFPDDSFDLRMPYAQIEDYMNEVMALKKEFHGKLRIYLGFEAEYLTRYTSYYERLLSNTPCEYLILGQHLLETEEGKLYNVYRLEDTSLYESYARNVVGAMRTGYFRYAAHPDLIFFNDHPWDIHCDRACDILIDGASKYGFALEYNANGLRRGEKIYSDGKRYPYPHKNFWDKVSGSNIPVYVGSDCHEPEVLYDSCMDMAYANLAKRNIPVCTEI